MKLGVIADDFTGASDIALTLAEGGMRAVQYMGLPNSNAAPQVDAGIVSLKSRTTPADDAVAKSLAACEWLLAQGVSQIVFKICSTFDSTIRGNIGPVAEALAEKLGETHVVVCPAFPENGRSVYQGHLFVGDRLLSESGMRDHPLTPMRDADLRRVLAAQTNWPVTHISASVVFRGAEAVVKTFPPGPAMIIVDAIHDEDLHHIGRAAQDRKLIVGGSGIALGLPANFGAVPGKSYWQPVTGAGAVLSGSCSSATREQVARYGLSAQVMEIRPDAVMAGKIDIGRIADWAIGQSMPPLIYSSADPESVRSAQKQFGQQALASAIEHVFTDLTSALVERGLSRLVVAGGETSGAAVAGLDMTSFEVGPRVAPGVPLLRSPGRDVAIALKSGNFGEPDFFNAALKRMTRE
jgi:uncharacterized protein YgbK (DUF1537 family)